MAANCAKLNDVGVGAYRNDMYNDTGAALVQGEFTVIGVTPVIITDGAGIASLAVGGGDIGRKKIRTDSFVTGESTFATPEALVYFSPTDKAFSDTETDGYYEVGQLCKEAKGSKDYIEFVTFERAVLVVT